MDMDMDEKCGHYRKKVQPVMAPPRYQEQGTKSHGITDIRDTYDQLTRSEAEALPVISKFVEGSKQ